MEEASTEDLVQLLAFYRQKASELEFQVLHLQLKINKMSLDNKVVDSNTMEHL